jgi:hypothetical protein
MNMLSPREPFAVGSVRAATKYRSAKTPLVMKVFRPFSNQPLSVRFAEVRRLATSEPASGSVTATAVISSPAITRGMYRESWSGVPKRARWGDAMSVCTRTVIANPPKVERPSSSASTTDARASSSVPPYSTGYRMPRRPSSPRERMTSRGTEPCSSHAGPFGVTCSAMNRRTCCRIISCSSVK